MKLLVKAAGFAAGALSEAAVGGWAAPSSADMLASVGLARV
jgi:hypothetical protein